MKKTIIICIFTLIPSNVLIGQTLPWWEYFNTMISAAIAYPLNATTNMVNKMQEDIKEELSESEHPYFCLACFTSTIIIFTALICKYTNQNPNVKRVIDKNGFSGSLAREGKIKLIPPPINTSLRKTYYFCEPEAPGQHSRNVFDDTVSYNPRYDIALPTPMRRFF